jgi:O-antigen/teichoic acid export membrane protein
VYLLSIPFLMIEGSFGAVLSVFKRFDLQARMIVGVNLFRLICLASAAPFGMVPVIWGHVVVAVVSFASTAGLALRLLRRHGTTPRGSALLPAWRRFAPFALQTSLTASLMAVAKHLEILALGALRPASEVGFFKIAQSAAGLISLPTAPAATVLYPDLTEAWATGRRERFWGLVRRYMRYASLASAAGYLLLFPTIDFLVRWVYGTAYLPVAGLVRILGLGVILGNVFHWVRQATLAQGRPGLSTAYNFGSFVLRLVLVVPLIAAVGVSGAAWSYVLATGASIFVLPRLGYGRASG